MTKANPQIGYSASELSRKIAISDRREVLDIPEGFFNQLVNELFYAQHPDQQGRSLTTSPEDADLRAAWDATATRLLANLSTLMPESRSRLGHYTAADLAAWEVQLKRANISREAFYESVDSQFQQRFALVQDRRTLLASQLWYALALDQLKRL